MPTQQSVRWALWVKRTDVDGAQYTDIAAQPDETVAQFKRRWVADKRLGIDVSLVSLHWVLKERPGKPTHAEEQAALCKERLLSDPSVTLRSAGVTDGCWLLALFAKGAGASYVVPFLQHIVALVCGRLTRRAFRFCLAVAATKRSFVELLLQGGIQRPSRDVLRLIELHFAMQASVVSDEEGAVHLYEVVQKLPGTRTKAAFAADLSITVGGPLFPAHSTTMGLLLSGTHSSGKSIVLKVLYAANAEKNTPDGEPMEFRVCDALSLGPWDAPEHAHFLVRATAVCMNVEPAEAHVFSRHGTCWAVVMPRYTATLGELAQLSLNAVAAGCVRMHAALDFMHSRGFVHADVKSANVLVTADGAWLLSDFGSCVRVSEPLKSTTEVFHTTVRLNARDEAGRLVEVPATTAFDMQLLFCMLLVEAFKADWRERLMPPGWGHVSERAMRGAYDELLRRVDAPEELRELARELNAQAYHL